MTRRRPIPLRRCVRTRRRASAASIALPKRSSATAPTTAPSRARRRVLGARGPSTGSPAPASSASTAARSAGTAGRNTTSSAPVARLARRDGDGELLERRRSTPRRSRSRCVRCGRPRTRCPRGARRTRTRRARRRRTQHHESLLSRSSVPGSDAKAVSRTANRPPGRSARYASISARRLSATRLITQFEMTTSTAPQWTGSRSRSPSRIETFASPASSAAARARARSSRA